MNEYNPFAAPSIQGDVALHNDPNSRVDFASLKTTGTGLTIIYIAILLQVLLGFAAGGFGIFATQRGGAAAFASLMMALGIIGILIGVLKLVAIFLCTTVPAESGAKGWIIGSAVIQAVSSAFAYLSRFVGGAVAVNWIFAFLMPAITTVLFMVFLQKLGTHMQRPDMTKRARRVLLMMIIGVIIAVVAVIGGFVPRFAGGRPRVAGAGIEYLLFMVFAVIYGLVVFVMYANVINAFGKYIRNPQSAMPRNHLG